MKIEVDDWEKMTGIFRVCRKCKYRKGLDCMYEGECEALIERCEYYPLPE
jgi:hypothetical protein